MDAAPVDPVTAPLVASRTRLTDAAEEGGGHSRANERGRWRGCPPSHAPLHHGLTLSPRCPWLTLPALLLALISCERPQPPSEQPQQPSEQPQRPSAAVTPPSYVGSDVCEACHGQEHGTWSRSSHGLNMALVRPDRVLGDFERDNEYHYEGTHSRMLRAGDRFFMEYTGPDHKTARHSVDYLLGVNRHQVYLHKLPDGRLQVLPTHWNVREAAWRDSREGPVTGGPIPLPVTSSGYWSNYSRTYNRACMECHASVSRKRFDVATHTYASTFDPSIGCEACHGPGGPHVAARQDPDPAAQALDPGLFDLAGLSQREAIDLCASCHARKRIYQEGFEPGERAEDYFVPDVWGDPGLFHVDGRSSEATTYNYVEFLQSACVRRSTERLDCGGGCHAPHAARATEPLTVQQSNRPCARCHPKYCADPSAHSFHAADSEGSRCVECHMPLADQMGMKLRDHTISVPLPELTSRFGVPNACTDCHRNDSAEWATGHVAAWYGQSPTFQAYRARTLQRAEVLDQVLSGKGASVPVPVLVDWLDNTAESIIQRGSAAKFLGTAARVPEANEALLRHLHDSEPVVRYYVVDALAHRGHLAALREALSDPARTVRLRAFEGLYMLNPTIAKETEPLVARVAAEYRHLQDVVRGDDPRLVAAVALTHFKRGDLLETERLLRHGVALTEPVPNLRVELIQFLLHQGRLDEVAREVEELEAVDPDSVAARACRARLLFALEQHDAALPMVQSLIDEGKAPKWLLDVQAVILRSMARQGFRGRLPAGMGPGSVPGRPPGR